eukprot:m.185697 g.185697  ORF g.185697 m.185697 type:complete len:162 (-) comp16527_c0_seq1:200-685(-)
MSTEEGAAGWVVPDMKAYLQGGWKLFRRIEDRKNGMSGTFVGTCRFVPDADNTNTLQCIEEGRVRVGVGASQQEHQADRTYTYTFQGPAAFSVAGPDGTILLNLDLTYGAGNDTHVCIKDIYRGQYELVGPDVWTQTWNVTGPNKDYTLDSRLMRVPKEST